MAANSPTATSIPLPAPTPTPSKQSRNRSSFSNAILFIIIVFCIFLPSPLSFSSVPNNLLTSAQSLNPLRDFRTDSSATSATSTSTSSTNKNSKYKQHESSGGQSTPSSEDVINKENESIKDQDTKELTTPTSSPDTNDKSSERTNKYDDSSSTSQVSKPPSGMEVCAHILLFTAPRHGSTWFLDCAEKCAFSQANDGTSFGDLNLLSELWNNGQQGPVVNISINDAADYVKSKISLKLFPTPFNKRNEEAMQLVDQSYRNGVPLVLLTRTPEAASKSFLVAKQNGVWNANSKGTSASENDSLDVQVHEKEHNIFVNNVINHYKLVKDKLGERQIPFDIVDYDEIKMQKYIVLSKNNCYVRNCNFR